MEIALNKASFNNFCCSDHFRIFAQQCKNIEELTLDGCKRISDRYGLLLKVL